MKKISLLVLSILFVNTIIANISAVVPKSKAMYNSVEDIFRTIDPTILPHNKFDTTLIPQSTSTFEAILSQKATDIRNYIATKYFEDLSDCTDKEVIVLGLVVIPFENRGTTNATHETMFNCLMTAVGAATGLGGMVKDFIAMWNSGATVTTLLRTVKNIFKIGVGWWLVGWAVYEFGDCVGWW